MKINFFRIITIILTSIIFYSCNKNYNYYNEDGFHNKLSNSQNIDEEIRIVLAETMVEFKNGLFGYFNSNQTFEQFKVEIFGVSNHPLTEEANHLLYVTYLILVENYSDQYIIDNYLGIEMSRVLLFLSENPSSDGEEYLNLTQEQIQSLDCEWYQIGCKLKKVLTWIDENKESLRTIASLGSAIGSIGGAIAALRNAFKSE